LKNLQTHTAAPKKATPPSHSEITEEKRLINTLKTSAMYSDEISDTIADLLIVLKPDFTIESVNRVTCDLLGYTEAELFGIPIETLFTDHMLFMRLFADKIMEQGTIKNPKMSCKTKSGKSIPVCFSMSAMYEGCNRKSPSGFICIAHDMREIDQLQDQVRHSQKLAEVGKLSAGFAHEIKNPLAIMIVGIESLRLSFSSIPNNAIYHEMLDRIENAAERADTIVTTLLNFSRHADVVTEKLDVVAVVDETISMVEHQCCKQNIGFSRHFSPEARWMKADKIQIQQVFINLMVNSIEAMPNGGNIKICTRCPETNFGEKCIQIIFTDTGCGIPEDKIHRVWEPIFSLKNGAMGTGLGLSISREIVEKHRGSMDIDSHIDKGTEAVITLPL
jgi:PAS domain S-box-containing protein